MYNLVQFARHGEKYEESRNRAITVTLGADYLADITAVLAKMLANGEPRGIDITIPLDTESGPVVFKGKRDSLEVTAVLMPLARSA